MTDYLQQVSDRGFGTMSFTWRAEPIPKEIAFASLNEAIKMNLPKKTFINGGELYGSDSINLEYLKEFFELYPDLRQHSIISIKGAVLLAPPFTPKPHKVGINESLDNILKYIPDLEIFEPARLHPDIPLEETIAALDEAVDNGRIKHYTLSEVGPSTLLKASKLSKHGISGIEVEVSLFTRDVFENDLAKIAGELNIPIIAYSPLSRGFLTGTITSNADIPAIDVRNYLERFTDENIKKNVHIVDGLKKIAEEKGVTPAQLALAWIRYFSNNTIDGVKYPKIIPIPSSSTVARVEENFKNVILTEDEFNRINEFIADKEVSGHRYNDHSVKFLSV